MGENWIELEDLDLKIVDKYIKEIDKIVWKMQWVRDTAIQDKLEFWIYYFSMEVAKLHRIYTRNSYKLSRESDIRFKVERSKHNSDLATTKKIKTDLRAENNTVELQEWVIDWLQDIRDIFKRIANHQNDMRIDDLAMAKRTPQ